MLQRIECTDTNGRKFGLMVKDTAVTQEWIDAQNHARVAGACGLTARAAIVEWRIAETITA